MTQPAQQLSVELQSAVKSTEWR